MENDLIITLPSNVSQEQFPSNRPWDYTTQLLHEIRLAPGDWKVSATGMYHSHKFDSMLEAESLGVFLFTPLSIASSRTAADSETNLLLMRAGNSGYGSWLTTAWGMPFAGKVLFRIVTVPAGHYESRSALGQALAHTIVRAFQPYGGARPYPPLYDRDLEINAQYSADETAGSVSMSVTLSVPPNGDRSAAPAPAIKLVIVSTSGKSTGVMKRLGFRPAQVEVPNASEEYAFYGSQPEATLQLSESTDLAWLASHARISSFYTHLEEFNPATLLFVYCDLVDYSIVGGTHFQLLGTFTIDPARSSGCAEALGGGHSRHATYVRVNTHSFRQVRIWIGDRRGLPATIQNPEAMVTVVLHFEKVGKSIASV